MIPWKLIYRLLCPQGDSARLSILIYHRVLPTADPLVPDTPDCIAFARQMVFIRNHFNVLNLGDAVAALSSRTLPERAICVTFDDGYADNFNVALPILENLDIPATVFVATDFLDGGIMFNDVIIEMVRQYIGNSLDLSKFGLGSVDVSDNAQRRIAINDLIGSIKYLPDNERTILAHDMATHSGVELPRHLMMTREQVRLMVSRGMDIGAHTMSHPILANLDESTVENELRGSKAELEKITNTTVRFFAYPNGKPGHDYLASQTAIVRNCGFSAAFTTAPGSASGSADLLQLPRYTPWERNLLRYGLQLAANLRRDGAKAK